MIKLVVSGCCGRMGARIAVLASQHKDMNITGAIEKGDNSNIGRALGEIIGVEGLKIKVTSDSDEAIRSADVLVEFTTPEATLQHLQIALKNKKAMVIGTTGIDGKGIKAINEAAKNIPIVFSPNMSVGVNLLFKLTRESAAVLKDYKINITEAHHKHKKDAPSGTAKKLAQVIKDVKGETEPPIKSIREGEIIGDHAITFDSEFETLQLSHHAKSRDVFASGAIVAAKFVAGKKKGLFSMQDVLI